MNYLIYFLFVFFGQYADSKIIYPLYLFLVLHEFLKHRKLTKDFLIAATIYSIILPDNYSTELIFLLYFLFTIIFKKDLLKIRKSKYNILFLFFIGEILISTVLNSVPIINIFFAILGLLPLFIFLCLANDTKNIQIQELNNYIDVVFFIETIATIINFVLYYRPGYDDWSRGTLASTGGQQSQLFVISSYLLIFYLSRYINRRERRFLFKAIVMSLIIFSTNCWTLLLMLLIGTGIGYLLTLSRKKLLIFFIILIMSPAMIKIGYSALPETVKVVGGRLLSDPAYFSYRLHKAEVYKETFVEIPNQDLKFFLLGNGMGYYNSRGALICTGKYTNFYNKLFQPSISQYTEDYILDYLTLAYNDGSSDFGSVLARPYSSILALMGEGGYIGCFLFLGLITLLLKRKPNGVIYLIIIWLFFCLVENYFEYTKVIIALYVCIASIQYNVDVKKTRNIKSQEQIYDK
ncbi:hypothetical protein AALB16_07955 [Lachnospiraceae bacterium 62-35]